MISTKYAKAAIAQISEEFSAVSRFITFLVQLLSMAYYGVMIYLNVRDVFCIVLYATLLLISLVTYILVLAYADEKDDSAEVKKENKKKRNRVKFISKLLNYVARTVGVIYAFYVCIVYQTGLLSLILTVLSATLIFLNLLIDGIIHLGRRYFTYLSVAIQADINNSGVIHLAEKASNPWKALADATGRLADRRSGIKVEEEEYVPTEKKERSIFRKLGEKIAQHDSEAEVRRQERREENKGHRAKIFADLRRIFHPQKMDASSLDEVQDEEDPR